MKKIELKNNKEFKVPSNYFDHLQESILNEKKRFDESSTFKTDDNYFSELETNILNSTIKKKQGKTRQLWITISSVAACVVLFVIGYTQFNTTQNSTTIGANKNIVSKVDKELENDVYESLYKSYFVEEDIKKSSNDISLDDLDEFYSDQQYSSNN